MNYPIVIHKDKASDYGITVPDLPGCFSVGSTMDQALAMAKEAIELQIEGLIESGQAVPAPGLIEEHQRRPEYAGGTWALVAVDIVSMRPQYDFSTGRPNPYAARLKNTRHCPNPKGPHLMAAAPLTIFCEARFPAEATELLRTALAPYRVLTPSDHSAASAPLDIAFGQPDPDLILACPTIRWVHVTSAGYTRYDRDDLRAVLHARGGLLTNSSHVFNEPCAQHLLAMMLSLSRQLPHSLRCQLTDHAWRSGPLRERSDLLLNQTALLYGYGAIARRLTDMLAPFHMQLTGVRRNPQPNAPIPIVTPEAADALLPTADHILDILPASPSTHGFFTAARIARMKPSAIFYNIGRGATVDQPALLAALQSQKLAAAYLDVTDPEPLPPDHPLWTAPNCYITAHTGGGHNNEHLRLVQHFLDNLERFMRHEPLLDQVY